MPHIPWLKEIVHASLSVCEGKDHTLATHGGCRAKSWPRAPAPVSHPQESSQEEPAFGDCDCTREAELHGRGRRCPSDQSSEYQKFAVQEGRNTTLPTAAYMCLCVWTE